MIFCSTDIVKQLQSLEEPTFSTVFGLGKVIVYSFVQQRTKEREKPKIGHPIELSAVGEVFLFLLYLKHAVIDALLGVLFNVSRKTAGNTRHRMLDFFFNWLEHKLTLKTLDWRLKHSIQIFHTTYTFIIDGTEQQVCSSTDPTADLEFYSPKKSKPTINILLVVSALDKKILYLSDSRPGSNNDPILLKESKMHWYDELDPQEHGIGDSIFREKEINLLGLDRLRIDTPPTERNEYYKVFAKARAPVENVIADMKDWSALRLPLRMNPKDKEAILTYHNKIWKVVGVFVNEYR